METSPEKILFSSLALDPLIQRALTELGYAEPTPIQAQAIPHVLAGRDLMAMAQTGTGKTAAFTLPMLQRLLPHASTSTSPARHPIRALILAPTRELAIQVGESVTAYSKHVPLRSTVVYGGTDIKAQKPALMKGVEVLVATPGRLLDHVESRNLQLNQVQMLILDEADRMLDMGFMPDLKRILALLPKQRQTLLFSATFSDDIKKLAQDFLNNPVTVETARRNAAGENIKQSVCMADERDKFHAMVDFIREREVKQVLIFTRTKLAAAHVAKQLERSGVASDAIHGDKSQQERIKALDAFKSGAVMALVATDVAARGLDIDQLPLVINYELPTHAEDYVHRIGRTGRAGASGEAVSFVDDDDTKRLADIEKLLNRKFPRETITPKPGYHKHVHAAPARAPATQRKQPAQDDWFSKPYEPSVSSASATASPPPAPAAPKKPQQQVAALFRSRPQPTAE
ncbi:MAG TPA: DEAD/DEAH box helicase [Gallionellaceae bacterium]